MKLNLKYYLLITVLLISFHYSIAQQNIKTKHSLGAGLGFTTGYGLSYRYTPNKLGFQINFAPYKTETITRISTGITFLYNLKEGETTTLFAYQANHFYSNSEPAWDNAGVKFQKDESYFNNGIGFGVEILVAKNIGLNFMTGYASYKNGKELNVTGEMALYFKF